MAGTDTTNTISSFTYRNKYFQANLQQVLRKAMVAEAVCQVDRSDAYTIQNPYSSQPTVTLTALTGTYSASNYTTTNDALTVTEEAKYAEHIYQFESVMSNFNLFADRADNQAYAIAYAIDKYVVNALCEDGTGTYSTPSGGFTTASNINTICANLLSKVMGYAEVYKGLFLVIEAGDTVGFTIAGATNGYSFADGVLNNGFMTKYMGIDIYVVATSTFVDETIGTKTVTNSGHRVFGVKGVSTYAIPRGITYEEISVAGRTGKEVRAYGVFGFKLWTQKAGLVVDITVTA